MELYEDCPIPNDEKMYNQFLFISRQHLMRFMFLNEIYQKIVNVHGCIVEAGTRWGQNLAIYTNLRGIYEPYNYNRKIIAFDTFNSFVEFDEKDGKHELNEMALTPNYDEYLDKVLKYHESENPIYQIQKYELIKGDACFTIPEYMKRHPETIIALIMLDFDIYKPTKKALEELLPYLTKGSIIIFDELNCESWAGETIAAQEVLGLDNYHLKHSVYSPNASYIIID
jgi:hypothetical protein